MRHLFLSRAPRERILILLGLAVGAFLWGSAALDRAKVAWAEAQSAAVEAETQALWLGRETEIQRQAEKVTAGLDAGKGYDAARLVAEAMALAKEAGLSVNSDPPKTQRSGAFAVHSVQLTCRRTDLASLIAFYQSIRPRAPYLALGPTSIQLERGGGGSVSARLQVTAVELVAR
ncbi:MAG: hypothetical protein ACO23N_00395 [Opitutales bacterium]|jgi:hypothetical protein